MSKIKNIKKESNIVKIYPTEEQCIMKTNVVCPDEECSKVFKTQSNLAMHVSQTHNKINFQKLSKNRPSSSFVQKEFVCPSCVISKPWKAMRDLREHFLKVHVEKNVKCSKCNNGFSSDTFMRRHFLFCGIKFTCQTCQCSYDSYETLKTHCRRKKHTCQEKQYFLPLKYQKKSKISVIPLDHLKEKMVLPQIQIPYTVIIVPGVPVNLGNHQNIQTNFSEKAESIAKMTQVNIPIMKCEQSTQTDKILEIAVSEGTQTLQEKKPFKREFIELSTQTQEHIEIQTDKIEMFENSCNTSFILEDFEFTDTQIIKSSCSTQTHKKDDFYSASTMTHDSIHTDTSDLLTDMSHFDTNFFNCNTETQTDFMLNDNELFDNDFYSNMYTQTCDDILSGMSNLTDIETQTMVDDVLKSVESQTLMSRNGKIEGSFINMETQTDSEFREMLEIINS